MKLFKRFFFLLSFISISYISSFAQENSPYFLHTIEKGQSLYSIASMYGVSKSDIVHLNPGCEEKIYAGQAIKIPQSRTNNKKDIFHTIQSGETLYRLTSQYNVSAKAICDANPGLSADNFRIGQVIRIPAEVSDREVMEASLVVTTPNEPSIQPAVKPRCKDMHRVERKETVFSISRAYGITEKELLSANPELQDGLKKGQFLCIPYPTAKVQPVQPTANPAPVNPPSDKELFQESQKESPKKISTIKTALILPFMPDGAHKGESTRMVEYYEGFLMAIDSLKRTGTSIDLYVYDSGGENTSINSILAKDELKSMDVIFGPLHQQHIKPLAAFAKKNDIRLVIPFTSKDNSVFNNPSIYQVNTPQSYLYSEVYEHFTRRFPNANVIFIEAADADKDKIDFIKGLKQELSRKGIPATTMPVTASQATMKAALRKDKENFFIPTSGSDLTLIKLLPQLTMLLRANTEADIHLFGYPEWQTYTKDHLESFFELDTYFYSSFYTNNLLPAAVKFNNAYRKWYSKDMANTYPKYGMLGFDTAFFFLKGLSVYGSRFENNLEKIDLTPIQTGFKFQRVNNWGGFVNKKVFFIHFTKDFELIKLDFE